MIKHKINSTLFVKLCNKDIFIGRIKGKYPTSGIEWHQGYYLNIRSLMGGREEGPCRVLGIDELEITQIKRLLT